jgi:short-subunit dehydrogenase
MNRIVVVTGGTSGIGKITSEKFLNLGDTVIILSKNANDGENNLTFQCDVANLDKVKEIFEIIKNKFGRIDVLINSAGYGISGASELLPYSELKNIFDVNVIGTINCVNCALPLMKNGAKIINISSVMAMLPMPFRTMYAATKSAVLTYSYGLQMELEQSKIDVCAICPGQVKTNFTKNRIKNYETNLRYGKRIENAANKIDKEENARMSPAIVANQIIKQCNKKHSKPMVIIGFKYKLLYCISKFFPISLVLKVINKIYGGNK